MDTAFDAPNFATSTLTGFLLYGRESSVLVFARRAGQPLVGIANERFDEF